MGNNFVNLDQVYWKIINIYNTGYISYESIFEGESTNIDLIL